MTILHEQGDGFAVIVDGMVVWAGRDYLAAFLVAKRFGYTVPSTPEQSRAYWKGVSGA